MNEHSLILAFLILSLSLNWSCSSGQTTKIPEVADNQAVTNSNSSENKFDLAEFNRNKELWKSQNIKNYKIKLEANGFLTNYPRPVEFVISNSKIISSKSLQKGNNYLEGYKDFNTIEKIFDFIEKEHTKKIDKLNVQFNEKLGYPIQIMLDEKVGIADDELSLEIISLEIVN